jgi:hypothetical protein
MPLKPKIELEWGTRQSEIRGPKCGAPCKDGQVGGLPVE